MVQSFNRNSKRLAAVSYLQAVDMGLGQTGKATPTNSANMTCEEEKKPAARR